MTESTAQDEAPATIPLRQVEHELASQMQAGRESEQAPAIRARMSNLVIYCDNPDQAERISQEIPAIVAIHPARVLLLVGEPGASGSEISAKVSAWCRLGPSKQKICSEQITLHAQGRAIDRLPFAVRRFMVGDLPVNFWWAVPQPPPSGGAGMYQLADTAQQVMYDSIGWPDPARGVVATAGWLQHIEQVSARGRWCVASDLNWRRLRDWRRSLAQAINPASAPGAGESIHDVLVEHGPHAVVQAWELSSWLARGLGWTVQGGKVQPGVELAWKLNAPQGDVRLRIKRLEQGTSEIHRLRIACKISGAPVTIDIALAPGPRLETTLEGLDATPRTVTVQPQALADLVGRQLSDRGRDKAFQASMAVAQSLAKCLVA